MARAGRQSWSETIALALTVGQLQHAVHTAHTAAQRRIDADHLDAATAILIDHLHRRHIYTPWTEITGHYMTCAADDVAALVDQEDEWNA